MLQYNSYRSHYGAAVMMFSSRIFVITDHSPTNIIQEIGQAELLYDKRNNLSSFNASLQIIP